MQFTSNYIINPLVILEKKFNMLGGLGFDKLTR